MSRVTISKTRKCRRCGCTERNACANKHDNQPCSWVTPTLCSACITSEEREIWELYVDVSLILPTLHVMERHIECLHSRVQKLCHTVLNRR